MRAAIGLPVASSNTVIPAITTTKIAIEVTAAMSQRGLLFELSEMSEPFLPGLPCPPFAMCTRPGDGSSGDG
jgi:hypothetical protein